MHSGNDLGLENMHNLTGQATSKLNTYKVFNWGNLLDSKYLTEAFVVSVNIVISLSMQS